MSAPEPSTTAKLVAAELFYAARLDPGSEEIPEKVHFDLPQLERAFALGQAKEAEHSRKVEGALERANTTGQDLDRMIEWLAERGSSLTVAPPARSETSQEWILAWPEGGAIQLARGRSYQEALAKASDPKRSTT